MNIAFFDVQPWEEEVYKNQFPTAEFHTESLTEDNAPQFAHIQIASTFIQSRVTGKALEAMTSLKLITTRSTGFDHIDKVVAAGRGITVCNVPEYGSNTVAEHTFALLLALTRKVYQSVVQLRNPDFQHENLTGVDLYGKTIGIVGLGKIGLRVAVIAKGFGMQVLVHNRTEKPDLAREYGFEFVSLPLLLSKADVITLHTPLTEETKHLINTGNVPLIKPGCYLINTARGGLIETESLVQGLKDGIFAGIGLDVLEEEQDVIDEISILTTHAGTTDNLKNLVYDHMLLHHPQVLITPHNAFNSKEALQRIADTTIANMNMFMTGSPVNTVG